MRAHTFRPGRPGDAETIAAYHHRCWVASFADLLEPGVVERMDPHGKVGRFRHRLDADSDCSTTVAELDGHAIGHTTVSGNEVVHLFIDPDHQGRGLGRALLDEAESMLREAGHRNAELHTRSSATSRRSRCIGRRVGSSPIDWCTTMMTVSCTTNTC